MIGCMGLLICPAAGKRSIKFKRMKSHSKEIAFVKKTIAGLGLNLEGMTVLTEIGSNYYFYLPYIAALAGAEKVYAWTAENAYFDCEKLLQAAKCLAKELGLTQQIEFAVNSRPVEHISAADIITNSGFVRPLNEELLKHCKKKVVIPLMFEA